MDRLDRFWKLSIIAMGIIAIVMALNAVETIFAPLALALVAGVVLSPVTDYFERAGYSPVFGALFGLVATLMIIAGLALVFQPVVAQLVDQAPKVWSDMQETIHMVRGLLKGLSDVSDDVSNAIVPEANAASTVAAEGETVALPTVTDAIMVAPAIVSQILVFAGALFFFLLTRREIYDWAAMHLADNTDRGRTAVRLREAERHVSRYFVTITAINAGLGLATGAALQAMGLPGGMLWGVVAFLMNYIVYLGPAIFVLALLFAGVAAFDGSMALAPAATFLLFNGIEGQFVTPTLVGRSVALNPLLVFLSLIFGIWLWGPLGGIVAIPLLLWVLVLGGALTFPRRTADEGTSPATEPAE